MASTVKHQFTFQIDPPMVRFKQVPHPRLVSIHSTTTQARDAQIAAVVQAQQQERWSFVWKGIVANIGKCLETFPGPFDISVIEFEAGFAVRFKHAEPEPEPEPETNPKGAA